MAARRLREVLPMLQLDGPTVEKFTTRLRKISRRVCAVYQLDVMLALLDELDETDRRGRSAIAQVREELRQLAGRARADLFRKKAAHDHRRLSEKLADVVETLRAETDHRSGARARQWAAKARVARRASDLKTAINAAGGVYLAARLRKVHSCVKKLRYGAELAADVADSVEASDVRVLARMQTILDDLDDVQALIDRVRDVQGSLATPDVKAWRDLDNLIISLENRCRASHARYVRERATLVTLCDRLVARAPAEGSAKRKVG
jgi:CHAD domain-containing protein